MNCNWQIKRERKRVADNKQQQPTIWGRSNSVNVQKVLWCLHELDISYDRIDAGKLGGPSRGTQSKGDEVRQPVEESALAILGIAGLERIVMLVTQQRRTYASQRLRRR